MTIKIYNENRLTGQPFFKDLIEYLAEHDEVMLRQIHKDFADVKNMDRQIDSFIAAGLILRSDKRYSLGFHIFKDSDFDWKRIEDKKAQPQRNIYEQPIFIEENSRIEKLLQESNCYPRLTNQTNQVILNFVTSFSYKEYPENTKVTPTLANYFNKVASNLPLTAFEKEIYQMIGDVDPEYALKYMTTFLLKFMRKDIVKNKSDIFVNVLEKYNYIEKISEKEYKCLLEFSEQVIPEQKYDDAKSFIIAQIQQTTAIEPFISLGDK
ncbi:DUF1803 domain-containing protein [Lactococcus cremoris]|uniref:DUF1803 domain-containing protein n=1 Tax=Lactococcus lactis subsp. cremoris TaxID=1359 RepID=UPI0009BEE9F3|nr:MULTISPECIES: DUF1803 domain-containing protein [Lactococcus]ARE25461.1 DUF1803 domain-containing protein [Lactococcus cremoris]MCT0457739.1 DUF1803 domain-containing protein [Lactococcus cremoris]MCT4415977.1 DUF1803 domain-containing protein [Lactococcus cremoris]MCT4417019.1 DUF1803 domain-containing protein [Lactococcus cremoris]MCT4462586.1 DUF1803 domain-containing protein [Lactococcus cremoris]